MSLLELPSVDASAPVEQASSPLSVESGSQFDVTSIDRNLRQIRSVESTWRLPVLPDTVRLDLAAQLGAQNTSISSFLHGIDHDVHSEPDVVEPKPVVSYRLIEPEPQRDAVDNLRVIFADLAQTDRPTSPSADSVTLWKKEAIERGFLDENTSVDSRWLPEYNTVRYEMMQQDRDARFRGDRIGAMQTTDVLDLMNKWLSPSGLLTAATELDLFWDFGAIGKEASNWGDKWRALSEAKNPFDFAGKFIDAATGPIDDIVIPALNLFLLSTGVGAAYNFGRVAFMGTKAVPAAQALNGLYSGGRAARALATIAKPFGYGEDAVEALKGYQAASGMANRLQKGNAVSKALGGSMAAWRQYTPVAVSRRAVSTGMQFGLLSNAQDLLPGYQGGASLADVSTIDENMKRWTASPLVWGVGEALFTPYRIFTPGSVVGGARSGGRAALGVLGSNTGRTAAGAVFGAMGGVVVGDDTEDMLTGAAIGGIGAGALPFIGRGLRALPERAGTKVARKAGYLMELTSFAPMADDQKVTAAFHRGMMQTLDGDDLDRYRRSFEENGAHFALAEQMGAVRNGQVDREQLGAAMSHITLTAALDYTAAAQARAMNQNGPLNLEQFHLFRNKLINQLRPIPVPDGAVTERTLRDMAWTLTKQELKSARRGKTESFNKKLEELRKMDPEDLKALAERHNQLATETMRQLLSAENLPEFADETLVSSLGEVGRWAARPADEKLGVIETYLPQALSTFGKWDEFSTSTNSIEQLWSTGALDGIQYAPAMSWRGRAKSLIPSSRTLPELDEFGEQVSKSVQSHFFLKGDVDAMRFSTKGRFSPFAQEIDPGAGAVTVAKIDTVSKQRLTEAADEMASHLQAIKALRRLERMDLVDGAGNSAGNVVDVLRNQGLSLGATDLETDAFMAGLQGLVHRSAGRDLDELDRSALSTLHAWARREGVLVDGTGFDKVINQYAYEAATRPEWAELGLTTQVLDDKGRVLQGVEAARRRAKELDRKARFTAAELDIDGFVQRLLDDGKFDQAAEVQQMSAQLKQQGYKLVHGVEYLHAHDLATAHGLPHFADVTTRNMNAMTLGNFFRGKTPEVAQEIRNSRHRAVLANALDEAGVTGLDLSPDSPDIRNLIDMLRRDVLEPAQELAMETLNEAKRAGFGAKTTARLRTSRAPVALESLGTGGVHHHDVTVALRRHFAQFMSDKEAEKAAAAAWKAVKKFRAAEFSDVGLYSLEMKLRQRNLAVDALKFMGGSEESRRLTLGNQRLGTVLGGYQGAVIGSQVGGEEDSTWTDIAQTAGGALLGAGAGKAIQAGGQQVAGRAFAERVLDGIESNPMSAWQRYGYMPDNLLRLRDQMRFTLSPFFDLSRYTEGLMLAQTAAPARKADGSRLTIPLNASPKGLKSRWAKEARAAGETRMNAELIADSKYEGLLGEFKAAARGNDFDPDTLDQMGSYFRQVGILGFDPTSWMATAFAHLRAEGLGIDEAYRSVREMYTYGTHGRSAAELSVNFIFFPFSFQKKAYTHLAQWINDDLMRAVMIHDMHKTYQALDERYDLNTFWKERVPALEKLQQLNMFAYGASLGRFGGLNRNFLEFGFNAVGNIFTPQGINIRNSAEAEDFQKLFRSLLPVVNDINHLAEDAKEQLVVLTSPNKKTSAAQAADGFAEWNQYKGDLTNYLERNGFTFQQMFSDPRLAEVRMAYEKRRQEIGERNPAWITARNRVISNRTALEMEKNDRLARAAADPANATMSDAQLWMFDQEVQKLDEYMLANSIADYEDLPLPVWNSIRALTAANARINPEWGRVWDKFYRSQFGPLEAYV